MTAPRRAFLRQIMQTAWYAYRNRAIPGSNVRTFADALQNAWRFHKAKAQPAASGPHLRLRSMVQSPIRRSMTGPYKNNRAAWAGRTTLAVGL